MTPRRPRRFHPNPSLRVRRGYACENSKVRPLLFGSSLSRLERRSHHEFTVFVHTSEMQTNVLARAVQREALVQPDRKEGEVCVQGRERVKAPE